MPGRIAAATVLGTLMLGTISCAHTPNARTVHHPDNAIVAKSEHNDHNTLSLPKRLAFMTGHVEAGLALYRAGEPGMAAKHLEHPVSETHASERVGLDSLGFDASLFIAVSQALFAGVPAAQIEPQLAAAQQNLATVSARAGGDARDIIRFLLDVIVEEYAIGVQNGSVSDLGEYQDAFGFTVVAIDRAQALDGPSKGNVLVQLNRLLDVWPTAPIPPKNPTSLVTVKHLVDSVRDEL